MLQLYFKTALRNLVKRRIFTLINVLGLALGLSSCAILSLYVYDQFTYDLFFEEGDHIYRVIEERRSPEGTQINSDVPYSLLGPISDDYPEVRSATAIAGPYSNQLVSLVDDTGQKVNFLESQVLLADSNFFKVFSFEMIHGDPGEVLRYPNNVVLTESAALRFFGSTDVVGKPIMVSNKSSIVTGVCQDPPHNSHFAFSYLVSSTSVRWFSQDQFNLRYAKCYLKVHPETHPKQLEEKFPDLVNAYLAGEIERVHKMSWQDFQEAGNGYQYFLRPVASIHLDPEVEGGMKAGVNPVLLKALMAVAFMILVIACINFTNLSNAQFLSRAREVGIRKVMGSDRRQLIIQFLMESFLISTLGVLVAVFLCVTLIPLFNSLFEVHIQLPVTGYTPLVMVLISVSVSLLVGIYPAFVLSGVKSIDSMKGRQVFGSSGVKLRYLLTGFQFWISILLLICTLIFRQQIQFIENRDLGFDQDQVLVLKGTFHRDANYTRPFLDEAKNITGVKGIAGTLWAMGFNGTWSDEYIVENSSIVHEMRRVPIGDGLAELMEFELIDGAYFSDQTNDSRFVMLNESAVSTFGLEDPVGKSIHMLTHDEGSLEKTKFTIKGVLRDFNYHSLREKVEPLVLQSNETVFGRMSYIFVKLDHRNFKQTMTRLENAWTALIPDRAFNYQFLDETLDANYRAERNLNVIFSLFSALSLIIGGIGLLGLSAFTSSLKKKEIGIRKTIGASLNSILLLLSKDYLKLFIAAFLLAIPIGWYAMDHWLTNFAYRITISTDIFVVAGVICMILTSVIVLSQTMKVAISNPIDSLRAD